MVDFPVKVARAPVEAIKEDMLRLSDASAMLMETLAKVTPGLPLPEDFPLVNLIHSLQESQRRIDREIAKASGIFIRLTPWWPTPSGQGPERGWLPASWFRKP